VAKSFARTHVQFDTGSAITLALYSRRALAKDAGVSPDDTGSHRILVDGEFGPFTDPDGFARAPGARLSSTTSAREPSGHAPSPITVSLRRRQT
jgi:hypothetical protein